MTPESPPARLPHEQRVLDELMALVEKWEKLRIFIESNTAFRNLPPEERARLERQEQYMCLYVRVLNERIGAFK
jgi:hypothetical protein